MQKSDYCAGMCLMVKKILFVCSGNLDRSPTAVELLKNMEGLEAKSAGTLGSAPTTISKEIIEWADMIFAMEERHRDKIVSICPDVQEDVVVLNIPDRYRRGDPELVRMLRQKLSCLLEKP
jgi:predicted protein tyrosine phosphatase